MGNTDSRCENCKSCPSCNGEASVKCNCSCENYVTCTCKCNVGGGHDVAQKTAAIAGGTALGVGGIALSVLTGGLAIPLVGAMVAGAGISSAIHGTVKAAKNEKISGSDYGIDVGVGFATGVIGGGGVAATESVASAVVSNVAKEACKRGAIKLGVRAAGGIVTGVASTAVEEAGNCIKGDKEWKEYGSDPMTWVAGVGTGAGAGVAGQAFTNYPYKLGHDTRLVAAEISGQALSNSRAFYPTGANGSDSSN